MNKKITLSIVVPAYNEARNLPLLIKKLHNVCMQSNIQEEILVVDDYSSDGTDVIITTLAKTFPVVLVKKRGKKGKAESLLEGFARAKGETIAMIDADLQYPPESIPRMLEKIRSGADIVVGKRKTADTSLLRKTISKIFHLFFSKMLHHLDIDVQSGLKMFRKEVVKHLALDFSGWGFDMPFLLSAKEAGYSIVSIPIHFSKRYTGTSKVDVFKTSLELGVQAVKLKMQTRHVIPYSNLSIQESAVFQFSLLQKIIIVLCSGLFILATLHNWRESVIVFISVITTLYFLDLLFNLFVVYKSLAKEPEITITQQELTQQRDWPVYTILCPLYKESRVLPQFVAAIKSLSYPQDKLQILLLLEEDDTQTITAAKQMVLPRCFEMVIVPQAQPKTKPKACNYGLSKAKGEYVVIFDAEDIPDIWQLKKTILAFEKSSTDVSCVQAKLNFYNGEDFLEALLRGIMFT